MKSMTAMNARRKQAGFTIIELVVVILLLGILAATALPRFMDVTDEAHAAVVDAITGGMVTGNALFRAQWVAEGQPLTTKVSEFNMFAHTSGYPKGVNQGIAGDLLAATACVDIYNNLLQTGRPAAVSLTPTDATALPTEAEIETATAPAGVAVNADVIAVLTGPALATSTECSYIYVGQFRNGTVANPATLPVIEYDFSTGEITRSTKVLNTN